MGDDRDRTRLWWDYIGSRFQAAVVSGSSGSAWKRITVRPQLPPQEKDRTGSSDKVDILITVPRNTGPRAYDRAGAIQITGVQGNMLVDSQLGDTTIESSEESCTSTPTLER